MNMAFPRRIAITGGIGSGKSFVCRILQKHGIPVFDCDAAAKQIIRNDAEVHDLLIDLVGKDVYDEQGALCKSVLAAYLCKGKEYSARVNAIVHPVVKQAFIRWVAEQDAAIVVMECALLYESNFEHMVDEVVCVSAPDEMRIERVMARDGITREEALRWMELQLPEIVKVLRATYVVYNIYSDELEEQLEGVFGPLH